jgi:hypothetical protein
MAKTNDPWDWTKMSTDNGGVPPLKNTLPQTPEIPTPQNLNGPRVGPVTSMMEARAATSGFGKAYDAAEKAYENYKFEQADKAQLADQGLNDAAIKQVQDPAYSAQPGNAVPVEDRIITQPSGPLANPTEPATRSMSTPANSSTVTPVSPEAVGAENTVATNAAPLSAPVAETATTESAAAATLPEGAVMAGMTEEELAMLAAQMEASAAASTAPEWLAALLAAA